MVHRLLDGGASNDDISIIVSAKNGGTSWTDHLQHGGPDAIALVTNPGANATSTADPNDDISMVEESDESQELAEDQAYEPRSQGQIEAIELEKEIGTGFAPDPPTTSTSARYAEGDALEQITIPGFAMIQGGGELATAALEPSEGDPFASVRMNLREEGVDLETATDIERVFSAGGVIVSLELSSGGAQAVRLDEIAEATGADVFGTFGAPRYTSLDGSPNPVN